VVKGPIAINSKGQENSNRILCIPAVEGIKFPPQAFCKVVTKFCCLHHKQQLPISVAVTNVALPDAFFPVSYANYFPSAGDEKRCR